jgi:hypothetical protein
MYQARRFTLFQTYAATVDRYEPSCRPRGRLPAERARNADWGQAVRAAVDDGFIVRRRARAVIECFPSQGRIGGASMTSYSNGASS